MLAFSLLLFSLAAVLCFTLWFTTKARRHGRYEASCKGVLQDHHVVPEKARKEFRLKMALRKVELPWLLLDENYIKEHEIRKTLFEKKGEKILGCKPIAVAACEELLEEVVKELLDVYPDKFESVESADGTTCVKILDTGEVLRLDGPRSGTWQLQTAATLAMEDFTIIIRDEETNKHKLHVQCSNFEAGTDCCSQASVSCFPVGWAVDERLDWPVHEIHAAVPRWQQQLQSHVERFSHPFPRLSSAC